MQLYSCRYMYACPVASVVSSSLRPHGLSPTRLLCPWDSPGKNSTVGFHELLQGTFLILGKHLSLLTLTCTGNGFFITVSLVEVVVLQSPSGVQFFTTPCHTSLSLTTSWSLPKFMSIASVMPSNHLILFSCLQSFPASRSFQRSQFFTLGGQSIGVSASALALPMNIQDWSPLGWTGWISLLSKGLSRVFSNTTDQKHQFFGSQSSLWSDSHIHTWILEKP